MLGTIEFTYLLQMAFGLFIWFLVWLGPFLVMLWMGYSLLSDRFRRQERARFFLYLVETAMKHGGRIEDILVSISLKRDNSLGVRFHLLAAYLEKGLSFDEALKKVPRVLPPQIKTMFNAGLKIGDISKVMPACRQLNKDAVSQTRGAINYLVLLGFLGFPINIVLLTVLQVYVFPQFLTVLDGMSVPVSPGLLFIMEHRGWTFCFQMMLAFIVWTGVLIYLGGPLTVWLADIFPVIRQSLERLTPWRMKRLQRDFSTMLAILLDAGMPEPEAITLAADCTNHRFFRRRAAIAVEGLRQGLKLPEAIRLIDDTGEFRWRLANAFQGHGGFFKAVAGWNESLDAKAFQQEQAAAHGITTGLVLVNGAMIGFIVVSIFSILIAIINTGVSW